MNKYTAQDFEDAQFAEHPDGRLAHRVEYGTVFSWSFERNDADDYAANEYMVADGWAPVPAQRTIAESEFDRVADSFPAGGPRLDLRNALVRFGFEFVEDREPTNAEKLANHVLRITDDLYIGLTKDDIDKVAKWLDEAGVKAPGGDDDR